MYLCCQCGKKLTNKQTYYLIDEEIGKRPCCKEDFKQYKWQRKAKERMLKFGLKEKI